MDVGASLNERINERLEVLITGNKRHMPNVLLKRVRQALNRQCDIDLLLPFLVPAERSLAEMESVKRVQSV